MVFGNVAKSQDPRHSRKRKLKAHNGTSVEFRRKHRKHNAARLHDFVPRKKRPTDLWVGTPPQHLTLEVSTRSPRTALVCDFQDNDDAIQLDLNLPSDHFVPSKSSTFGAVCPACLSLTPIQSLADNCELACRVNGTHPHNRRQWSGYEAKDLFRFVTDIEMTPRHDTSFVCLSSSSSTGVLGLAQPTFEGFTLCDGGDLRLGVSPHNLVYAANDKNVTGNNYATVVINKLSLQTTTHVEEIHTNLTAVVDPGTPNTKLDVGEAYRSAWQKVTGKKYDSQYMTLDERDDLPVLHIYLQGVSGDVVLEVPPERYMEAGYSQFFRSKVRPEHSEESVLGWNVLQRYLHFDIPRQRIGFADKCFADSPSPSPFPTHTPRAVKRRPQRQGSPTTTRNELEYPVWDNRSMPFVQYYILGGFFLFITVWTLLLLYTCLAHGHWPASSKPKKTEKRGISIQRVRSKRGKY